MFCSACESLFAPGNIEISESKTLSYSPRFKHHPNGRALKAAALGGCPLCLRVWTNFSKVQRDALCGDDLLDCIQKKSGKEVLECNQKVPAITGQIQRYVREGCYKFDFRCGSVKWHFITGPSIATDDVDSGRSSWQEDTTSAELVVAQADRWLTHCLEHHDCGAQTHLDSVRQQWLPTRLIDIGAPEESTLRVVSSEGIPPSSLYMTLSHCWGLVPIFRLLTSNLELLYVSIAWDSLTLTFRNAVTITRRLGIRYLWIDSA